MNDDARGDAFGRSVRLPGDFTRAGRVLLLHEAFEALMRGVMPSDEARIFLAASGLAWLREGGSIERRYWRTSARRGSHRTAQHLLRERAHHDERQDDGAPSDWHEATTAAHHGNYTEDW